MNRREGPAAAFALLVARISHALEHHPRHVTALLASLLVCGAGGALAVASTQGPDAVDPSTLPVRQVVEPVQPLPLQPQADLLEAFRFNLYRTEASRSSDTAERLLSRLGINDAAAAAFLRRDATFRAQVLSTAGRNVTAEASSTQHLQKLSVRWVADNSGRFTRFVVERQASGQFVSRTEAAPLVASLRLASGTVRSSFFDAMDDAGVGEPVARQLLSIFEGDIDFTRGLKSGDRFNVVYEALEADGEPMRTGKVVSAEITTGGKLHQAMWYQEPGKDGGYFDLDGRSLARSYLAAPLDVTRITSSFAMRFHPILHAWKRHMGVDYGGAVGTPVHTIGNGKVRWAGRMSDYGNLVVVDHGDGDETYYAHLSRIDVAAGQTVKRGQNIGALGRTGRVTGPHLHFEFREGGVNKDPIEALRNNQAQVLSPQAKADFIRLSQRIRAQFAAANVTQAVASAR